MSITDKNEENARWAVDFERSGRKSTPWVVQEFVQFLCENKKWWLLPIVFVVGLVGLLVGLSSTGAAPFIYTLF